MPTWLAPGELRIGLGCMRLPEDTAAATIESALAAGVTMFDTARAYEGSETLVARALRGRTGRVVTKGGMSRPGGAWVPDGRAKAIRADCEGSLEALDGLPIDLYLLHAPDPRTPWRTSVRALAKLVDDGLVSRIGLCNVSRDQLEEAVGHAPIAAVESPLSVVDDRALRGGLLERCVELELTFIAHSPLGGPRGIGKLRRHPALSDVAAAHSASAEETALAWLLSLGPNVIAVPGARTPQAAASAARAAALNLSPEERSPLGVRRRRTARAGRGEVVVVMGIPGAGKSRIAADYAARGYVRLNRDELGGSLRDAAVALDGELHSGTSKAVLDNTYLTRAARSEVVDVAARHGLRARLVCLDTPLAQAQVNLVERLLERFDRLPSPEELVSAGRSEPGLLSPTRQMRALRELEEPGEDEGFADIERKAPSERASSWPPRRSRSCRPATSMPRHRISSSTGAPRPSRPTSRALPRSSRWDSSRRRCARIPEARRPAGAVHRFPACSSSSHVGTASTQRARFSSARAPLIERSQRRWARPSFSCPDPVAASLA